MKVSSDFVDYSKFPYYSNRLKSIGLTTPYEQYGLYATTIVPAFAVFYPIRQAYYLNKYLHENDPHYKVIWAAKSKLTSFELGAGEKYLKDLRKTSKRYACVPLTFILFEGIRIGYRKLCG